LRAGERNPAGQREAEAGGDPQHIPLAGLSAELAQLSAVAINLIAADDIEGDAVSEPISENVDGQLPLVRNTRSPGKPMISDFTGSLKCSAGIHCRAPISA
jgi:hypothetical protein